MLPGNRRSGSTNSVDLGGKLGSPSGGSGETLGVRRWEGASERSRDSNLRKCAFLSFKAMIRVTKGAHEQMPLQPWR